MTKLQALLGAALLCSTAAVAQTPGTLTVKFPATTDTLIVAPLPIAEYYGSNRRAAIQGLMDTVVVTGSESYTLDLDPEEALSVMVAPTGARPTIVYAAPGETLSLDLTTSVPVMKGSALVEGISDWNIVADSIVSSFRALPKTATDEQRRAIVNDLNSRAVALAAANADNALGVYMLTAIQDEDDMIKAFEALGPGAVNSILAPMYQHTGSYIAKAKAIKAAAEYIQVGKPAPDFTLPDPEGNMVSLSQFKGKWVMLDFWGSWCGWCIKGIPQMKEQWAELKDRDVVFLSIACGDSKEVWLNSLKEYDLPWVNVWSDPQLPSETSVQSVYAVKGFPTKLVIDPKGNIALIVVGEDPTFYDQLRALL